MPLQAIAAASLSICNSVMQSHEPVSKQVNMPCHEGMVTSVEKTTDKPTEKHKNQCKAACATLCASLCAMSVLSSNIKPVAMLAATQALSFADQTYASITQPKLQRPPIFVS